MSTLKYKTRDITVAMPAGVDGVYVDGFDLSANALKVVAETQATATVKGWVIIPATSNFTMGVAGVHEYYIDISLIPEGTVTITPETGIPVTGITVSGADGAATVAAGETLQMEADVLPVDADNKTVEWSAVAGTGTAGIDEDSGLLTGGTSGDVTVTAVAKDGSGITGSAVVTVIGSPYHPDDVAAVRRLISVNGLAADPADPASWTFAAWDTSMPKRITSLELGNKGLTGNVYIEKMASLRSVVAHENAITGLSFGPGCGNMGVLIVTKNRLDTLEISSLSNLAMLHCDNNNLTSLDVSGATGLSDIYCSNNMLRSLTLPSAMTTGANIDCSNNKLTGTLDVSALTTLANFDCSDNKLTGLNLGTGIKLGNLDCSNNLLTTLDVSSFTQMYFLDCSGNALTVLDVSPNTILMTLKIENNPLTSVVLDAGCALALDVAPVGTADITVTAFDFATKEFEITAAAGTGLEFDDHTISAAGDFDGTPVASGTGTGTYTVTCVPQAAGAAVTFHTQPAATADIAISEATGAITVLEGETLTFNAEVTPANAFDKTVKWHVDDTSVATIDEGTGVLTAVSAGTVHVYAFQGASYGVATKESLPYEVTVYAAGTPATYHPGDVAIIKGIFDANGISYDTADPAVWPGVSWSSDVTNRRVAVLYWGYGNLEVTDALDLAGLEKLKEIDVSGNRLTEVRAVGLANLKTIDCRESELLESLDVTGCVALENVNANDCRLENLTLGTHPRLQALCVANNRLSGAVPDLKAYPMLEKAYISSNGYTGVLDVAGMTALTGLYCDGNQLTGLTLGGNAALGAIIADHNSLTGTLNVSQAPALKTLYVYNNSLTGLNVDGLALLEKLYCYSNPITSLDLTDIAALDWLMCYDTAIATLDLTGNPNLWYLACGQNPDLASLALGAKTALSYISCEDSALSGPLDLTGLTSLRSLFCHNNDITAVDASGLAQLTLLRAEGNPLRALKYQDRDITIDLPAAVTDVNVDNFDLDTHALGFTVKTDGSVNITDWTAAPSQAINSGIDTDSAFTYYASLIIPSGTAVVVSPTLGVPVTGITVTGAGGATSVKKGQTLQMDAVITPSTADNQNIEWEIDAVNPPATINASGLLTATAVGNVRVYATARDGSGVRGYVDITITKPDPTRRHSPLRALARLRWAERYSLASTRRHPTRDINRSRGRLATV